MPRRKRDYHLVWTTKNRAPLIEADVERTEPRSIADTARSSGAVLHAAGVIPDHIHIANSIPPSASNATVVGRLKGASSHAVTAGGAEGFKWQADYGVFSFSECHLPTVIDDVLHQHERHMANSVWDESRTKVSERRPTGLHRRRCTVSR